MHGAESGFRPPEESIEVNLVSREEARSHALGILRQNIETAKKQKELKNAHRAMVNSSLEELQAGDNADKYIDNLNEVTITDAELARVLEIRLHFAEAQLEKYRADLAFWKNKQLRAGRISEALAPFQGKIEERTGWVNDVEMAINNLRTEIQVLSGTERPSAVN